MSSPTNLQFNNLSMTALNTLISQLQTIDNQLLSNQQDAQQKVNDYTQKIQGLATGLSSSKSTIADLKVQLENPHLTKQEKATLTIQLSAAEGSASNQHDQLTGYRQARDYFQAMVNSDATQLSQNQSNVTQAQEQEQVLSDQQGQAAQNQVGDTSQTQDTAASEYIRDEQQIQHLKQMIDQRSHLNKLYSAKSGQVPSHLPENDQEE